MIRYDGWYDFEAAIEVLLKAKFGMGIESWGLTRGDWGRDAYFKGTLPYPANVPTAGNFVFQCKFVQNANAAGARKPQRQAMHCGPSRVDAITCDATAFASQAAAKTSAGERVRRM